MGYRAVSRLKFGKDDYLDRGEKVTAKDVGGKEELERLVASGSVLEDSDFDVAFPGFDKFGEDGANQPTGTPSNLEPVEGTDLAADPEASGKEE